MWATGALKSGLDVLLSISSVVVKGLAIFSQCCYWGSSRPWMERLVDNAKVRTKFSVSFPWKSAWDGIHSISTVMSRVLALSSRDSITFILSGRVIE